MGREPRANPPDKARLRLDRDGPQVIDSALRKGGGSRLDDGAEQRTERRREVMLGLYFVLVIAALLAVPFVGLLRDTRGAGSADSARTQPLPATARQAAGQAAATEPGAETMATADEALPGAPPTPGTAPPQASGRDGTARPYLSIDFSLADIEAGKVATRVAGDGSIRVRKPVRAGSQALGNVEVTIDEGSVLLIEAREVRALLARRAGGAPPGLSRLPEAGLVSFESLRDLGVDLRYSPAEDAITLNP